MCPDTLLANPLAIRLEKIVPDGYSLSESGNEFTSTNTFELPLPNGQVMRGCSTGVGRRMELE